MDEVREIVIASAGGDVEKVKEMLDRNPELASAYSSKGATPLHGAAAQGQYEVAALLIARGADVNAHARGELDVTPCTAPQHFVMSRWPGCFWNTVLM